MKDVSLRGTRNRLPGDSQESTESVLRQKLDNADFQIEKQNKLIMSLQASLRSCEEREKRFQQILEKENKSHREKTRRIDDTLVNASNLIECLVNYISETTKFNNDVVSNLSKGQSINLKSYKFRHMVLNSSINKLVKSLQNFKSSQQRQLFGDLDEKLNSVLNANSSEIDLQPVLDKISSKVQFFDANNEQILPQIMNSEVTELLNEYLKLSENVETSEMINIKLIVDSMKKFLHARLSKCAKRDASADFDFIKNWPNWDQNDFECDESFIIAKEFYKSAGNQIDFEKCHSNSPMNRKAKNTFFLSTADSGAKNESTLVEKQTESKHRFANAFQGQKISSFNNCSQTFSQMALNCLKDNIQTSSKKLPEAVSLEINLPSNKMRPSICCEVPDVEKFQIKDFAKTKKYELRSTDFTFKRKLSE